MTRSKHKVDLLIQFSTLIVLFLCWPVGADKVVESYDQMKSLMSDVNGLEGEPLHSSARPNDIASLNVARQQEPAEPFVKFRCVELQIKDTVKSSVCVRHPLLATVRTFLGPRFKDWSETARGFELPGWRSVWDSPSKSKRRPSTSLEISSALPDRLSSQVARCACTPRRKWWSL